MTQDEIIRMARDAGGYTTDRVILLWEFTPQCLERFAALVAAHERDACAKVCDEFGVWRDTSGVDCAEAIRARGEK